MSRYPLNLLLIVTETAQLVIGRAISLAIVTDTLSGVSAAAFIMGYIFSELFIEPCAASTERVPTGAAYVLNTSFDGITRLSKF